MKKTTKLLVILLMFILGISDVYALNIDVDSINITDKSDTITVEDYNIKGNIINSNITFNELNDYVTFEIKLKNNEKDTYTIENISDDNTNQYIKTKYEYDTSLDKPIYLTLSYDAELEIDLELNNINITITLLDKKGNEEVLVIDSNITKENNNSISTIIENPNTGILLSVVLSILAILLVVLIYYRYYKNKKNISTMILMLGLLLIPVSIVLAETSKVSLILNTENISVAKNGLSYVTEPQVPGKITVGDELAVDTEHFYVVSSNEEETVLLSKYNLNVGDSKNPDVEEGIQHESVIGYNGSEDNIYGAIPFTNTSYWSEENNLNKYGTDYPIYVYDENSNLYEYVENYRKKLDIDIIDIRLMNYEEAIALGCRYSSCESAQSWVYSTTYWLGTAKDDETMYGIVTTIGLNYGTYDGDYIVGVRPVIVVPTSDIDV